MGYVGRDVQVSAARPANTTAYAAGDVVGATAAAWEFADMGEPRRTLLITGVELRIDVAGIPSGMTTFTLALYKVTPPSALADNAAWDIPSGDRASFLGLIDGITPANYGSTLYASRNNVNKAVKLASSSLFAYLITDSAFTPTSAAVKAITIHGLVS